MIELKNVFKIYKTNEEELTALNDVSLTLERGEMVAVIGESGSGKSTLLNIIGCMDTLTKGSYKFNEIVVSDLKGEELSVFRKNHISFVFQTFSLLNNYTAEENVEVPLLAKRVPRNERKKIIMDALTKVGLAEIAKKNVSKLSGGQQQRVAIARDIASGNNVILADEPTGALDSKTSTEIMNLFESLNKEGMTIIIVTHDSKVAERCQRIVRISDGRIM